MTTPRYRNKSAKPSEKFVNKYELTDHEYFMGELVYRIRALKDFGCIKAGDLGGWVSGEHNLSQYGTCWIGLAARAYQQAQVRVDAQICGYAVLSENAITAGDCEIFGSVELRGHADIADEIKIGGYTIVGGKIKLRGNRKITSQYELMAYIDERRAVRA